jgi:hypothetical protein
VIPVSWPKSRVWKINLGWYWFLFFFNLFSILIFFLISSFKFIFVGNWVSWFYLFFFFIRLIWSHDLGCRFSGLPKVDSGLFWSFFFSISSFNTWLVWELSFIISFLFFLLLGYSFCMIKPIGFSKHPDLITWSRVWHVISDRHQTLLLSFL